MSAADDPAAWTASLSSAPRWLQLHVFPDRSITREPIARAVELAFEAFAAAVPLPVIVEGILTAAPRLARRS